MDNRFTKEESAHHYKAYFDSEVSDFHCYTCMGVIVVLYSSFMVISLKFQDRLGLLNYVYY